MIQLSYGKVNRIARRRIFPNFIKEKRIMQEKDFVTYEYRTKTVKARDQAKAMDLYEAFGWEVTATAPNAIDGVMLSMKRDRRQKHKQELTRLERKAEDNFEAANGLRRAQTLGACIFAYIFGCIAVLILGGGMSLIMTVANSIPATVGGIILGVAGLALCGVNYLIYKKLVAKKTKQILPVLDETEERLANLMEQGNDLLRADVI